MNPQRVSIHLEQVHLDLRGFPPATAAEAVHALGPALRNALTNPCKNNLQPTAGMSAAALAHLLAQRLAANIQHEAASPPENF